MPASRFRRMAAAICRSLWARRMLLLPSACLQLDFAVWLPPYAAPYGRGACFFFCPHAYSSIPPYGCRHMPLPVSAAHASSSVRMPTARFRCFAASSRCMAVAICCRSERCRQTSLPQRSAPQRMQTSLLQRVAGRILRLGRFLLVFLLQSL